MYSILQKQDQYFFNLYKCKKKKLNYSVENYIHGINVSLEYTILHQNATRYLKRNGIQV